MPFLLQLVFMCILFFLTLYVIRSCLFSLNAATDAAQTNKNDMTDFVHLPNSTFAHDRMHLAPPNGLQGGAYFSMLYYKDAPLYIQTPACTSRQGVVSGKRPYIDLMFSNHDVPFLEWLEAMETTTVRLIYEKRNAWISSDIEKSDIEAGFTSPVRPYKGGKHYLIRAHIQPAKHLASPSCSVFDENERPVPVEYIKPEQQMYTVLEFQGIKFTARSFQFEVALKQVLIVPNVPIFQSCVIRKPSREANEARNEANEARNEVKESNESNEARKEVNEARKEANEANEANESNESNKLMNEEGQLQEVNMDGLDELEHMHMKLKKPTEVYYNMYRIAKQKARELKKNAVAAYLEAKQIKSAHMLEDSSDESDEDEYA